ncbi:MAG: hypothetical protein Q8O88_03120 [bacterium]|nr:hypothetical protein [bacterium]
MDITKVRELISICEECDGDEDDFVEILNIFLNLDMSHEEWLKGTMGGTLDSRIIRYWRLGYVLVPPSTMENVCGLIYEQALVIVRELGKDRSHLKSV